MAGKFDESKHPRDHGKFSSKAGGSGKSDDKSDTAKNEKRIEKIKGLLERMDSGKTKKTSRYNRLKKHMEDLQGVTKEKDAEHKQRMKNDVDMSIDEANDVKAEHDKKKGRNAMLTHLKGGNDLKKEHFEHLTPQEKLRGVGAGARYNAIRGIAGHYADFSDNAKGLGKVAAKMYDDASLLSRHHDMYAEMSPAQQKVIDKAMSNPVVDKGRSPEHAGSHRMFRINWKEQPEGTLASQLSPDDANLGIRPSNYGVDLYASIIEDSLDYSKVPRTIPKSGSMGKINTKLNTLKIASMKLKVKN